MKGRCAIVISYDPQARDISTEETGAHTETDKQLIFNTYTELLREVQAGGRASKTEAYEDAAKADFRDKPAQMKYEAVVDKLLTGFDAPPCLPAATTTSTSRCKTTASSKRSVAPTASTATTKTSATSSTTRTSSRRWRRASRSTPPSSTARRVAPLMCRCKTALRRVVSISTRCWNPSPSTANPCCRPRTTLPTSATEIASELEAKEVISCKRTGDFHPID